MRKTKFRTPAVLLPKVLEKVEGLIAPNEYPYYVDVPSRSNQGQFFKGPIVILQNRNRPKNYLLNLIATNLTKLDIGGRILLISHKSWGAKSLVKLFEELKFSTQIDTIFTGFEGFRVVEIVKTHEDVEYQYEDRYRFIERIDNKYSGHFEFEFVTTDKLFSYKHLDEGTRVLLENTKFAGAKKIMDLGCGWGGIGIFAHLINPDAHITLVDEDIEARKIAGDNVKRSGDPSRFTVTTMDHLTDKKFDLIVSYPPFHISNINVNQLVLDLKEKTRKGTRLVFCTDQTFLSKYQIALEAIFEKEIKIQKIGKFNLLSLTC